jgi:hypothetical protein
MRYIEGYLLSPNAIAKATGSTTQEIIDHVNKHFAVDLSGFHTGNDIPTAFRDLSAKEILEEHKNALKSRYTFKKIDIARNMSVSEIHSDIRTVLTELTNFSK